MLLLIFLESVEDICDFKIAVYFLEIVDRKRRVEMLLRRQ